MNPKDKVGQAKVCLSNCPIEVVLEVACALTEGKLKYGRYNWRHTNVNVCVYTDAAIRHISSFVVGEDIDPDSGLHHITKAIASLVVLRDAIMHDCANDDRPPNGIQVQGILNEKVAALIEKYGAGVPEAVASPPSPVTFGPVQVGSRWHYYLTPKEKGDIQQLVDDGFCSYDCQSVPGRASRVFCLVSLEGSPNPFPFVIATDNLSSAKSVHGQVGSKLYNASVHDADVKEAEKALGVVASSVSSTNPQLVKSPVTGGDRWRYQLAADQMATLDSRFKRGYCGFDGMCCLGRQNDLYTIVNQDGIPSADPFVFSDSNMPAVKGFVARGGQRVIRASAVLK